MLDITESIKGVKEIFSQRIEINERNEN